MPNIFDDPKLEYCTADMKANTKALPKALDISTANKSPHIMRGVAVAKRLGVSWLTLKNMCEKRLVPHIKIGRYYRFEKEQIDAYLQKVTRLVKE